MPENKDTLALELRQIIQADRQAADIIQQARDSRKRIRAEVEKKKAAILADAETQKQETLARVQAQQATLLEQRKKQAQDATAKQREELDKKMAQGREGWIEAITTRILDGEKV